MTKSKTLFFQIYSGYSTASRNTRLSGLVRKRFTRPKWILFNSFGLDSGLNISQAPGQSTLWKKTWFCCCPFDGYVDYHASFFFLTLCSLITYSFPLTFNLRHIWKLGFRIYLLTFIHEKLAFQKYKKNWSFAPSGRFRGLPASLISSMCLEF